jgi:hypothetical protein
MLTYFLSNSPKIIYPKGFNINMIYNFDVICNVNYPEIC